jgi:homocysteine S-methyltransferase
LKLFTIWKNCGRHCFAARELAPEELALVTQITVGADGNLPDSASAERFTRCLDEWPVDVIGCNCSLGPEPVLQAIEGLQRRSRKPRLIGGCCGTTPEHIRLIRSEVERNVPQKE